MSYEPLKSTPGLVFLTPTVFGFAKCASSASNMLPLAGGFEGVSTYHGSTVARCYCGFRLCLRLCVALFKGGNPQEHQLSEETTRHMEATLAGHVLVFAKCI